MRVTFKANRFDGGEFLEASRSITAVPRSGDVISVWDPKGTRTYDVEMVYLTVDYVVFSLYSDQIEVWLTMETFDVHDLESTDEFGIHNSTASNIIAGRRWTSV